MKDFLARWMPIDASTHGAELDSMNAWVHWLMAILFVGWSVYFVYVLLRFRAGRSPKANYEGVKSHFGTWIEGGVVVVEAILLIGFAIPAWARWVTPHSPESDPLVVRVVGEQFAWNIHYPGPDEIYLREGLATVALREGQAPQGPCALDRRLVVEHNPRSSSSEASR